MEGDRVEKKSEHWKRVERRCSHLTIWRLGPQAVKDSTFFLRGPQPWQRTSGNARALHAWSACAAEGVTSASQCDRDQAQKIRELRQEVQDLTRRLEAISLGQAQPPERDVRPGWSSDQWRSWKADWWDGRGWTSSAAAARGTSTAAQQAQDSATETGRRRIQITGQLHFLCRLENGISLNRPAFWDSPRTT